jgi:hypothetical protein
VSRYALPHGSLMAILSRRSGTCRAPLSAALSPPVPGRDAPEPQIDRERPAGGHGQHLAVRAVRPGRPTGRGVYGGWPLGMGQSAKNGGGTGCREDALEAAPQTSDA